MPNTRTLSKPQAGLRNLLGELRGLIQQARQQAHRAVDLVHFQAFPIRGALRHELSWTHYRLLMRLDNPFAREWYAQETLPS